MRTSRERGVSAWRLGCGTNRLRMTGGDVERDVAIRGRFKFTRAPVRPSAILRLEIPLHVRIQEREDLGPLDV
jgi:hypothetical protein